MSEIDIEITKGQSEGTPPQENYKAEMVKYKGIDKEYPEYHIGNEHWFHHVVAEQMFRISSKQFDRWCDDPCFDPKIEKRRFQTDHYSYIFLKLSDLQRIAEVKRRALRMPLKDIASTDPEIKTLSLTDARAMAKDLVLKEIADYDLRIQELINKTDTLHAQVNRLTVEKAEIIESKSNEISKLVEEKSQIIELKSREILQIAGEKQEIISKKDAEINQLAQKADQEKREKAAALDKKNSREKVIIGLSVLVVVGVIGTGLYAHIIYKDNDRLYDVSNSKTKIILSKDEEIHILKEKMANEENQYLKSKIDTLQNEEINAVKKD